LKLADTYKGLEAPNGEEYNVEAKADGPKPFRCYFDIGLTRTTTGNRIFGVLKGAVDGGLSIPHSVRRFAGYDEESKSLDAEVHRKYIFGGHVSDYMEMLMDEDADLYKRQFASYIKNKIEASSLEDMYKKAHAAIRKDPAHKSTAKPEPAKHKRYARRALTLSQRKDRVRQKKESFLKKLAASEDQ